jgi:hypothetical protein
LSQTIAVTESEWPKKYNVRCETCRVSQGYYTEVGVRYFTTIHSGHDVVEGIAPVTNTLPLEKIPTNIEEPEVSIPNITKSEIEARPLPKIAEAKRSAPIAVPTAAQTPKAAQTISKQVRIQSVAQPEMKPAREVSIFNSKTRMEEAQPTMLLGKFSFVKAGEAFKAEAIRVSNVLRTFRWKVEPPYVIGALFDDNLSIQSNTGVISREVIMGIEELGYNFVAIESPKCTLTAWFRREAAK